MDDVPVMLWRDNFIFTLRIQFTAILMRQDNPQTTSLTQEPSAVPQGLSQQQFTQFLCHIWLYFVELL